jgi:hypothetical protein
MIIAPTGSRSWDTFQERMSVGLLALVQILRELVLFKSTTSSSQPSSTRPKKHRHTLCRRLVVGLSGPYDINNHFDFEAAPVHDVLGR